LRLCVRRYGSKFFMDAAVERATEGKSAGRHAWLRSITFALLPSLLAVSLQWFYHPLLDQHDFLFFYPAVFASAWLGGLWPGVTATALTSFAAWWWFLPPSHSFDLDEIGAAMALLVYASLGVLISLLHERLRLAQLKNTEALQAVNDRESEARFHQMANSLPQLIWTCAPDGSCDFLSPQWAQFTGIPAAQQLGFGWLQCVHPEDHAILQADWQASVNSARPFHSEFRIRQNNGVFRWFDTRATPLLDSDGHVVKWFGSNTDIDERKRSQELHLRTQKMESLGTLAGGIAHDFNNILLAIRGNTKLALEDLPPHSRAHESLVEIDKASSRAADLIRRILAFSRKEEPKPQLVSLQPVITEALQLLRATLPAMIKLDAQFALGVPPTIADTTQIHQIIMNLATNAAYAIGNRAGVVTISLDAVVLDSESAEAIPGLAPGPYSRLSVTDTGCGMDQETLRRIFDPFFTTKPPGQGTGLGLSVVDGIMKSHGGLVTAYSELGKGTALRLYFPAATGTVTESPQPQCVTADVASSGSVLYVDDDEALVSLAGRTLKRAGYHVTGCDDPVAALELFKSRPQDFDVVVSDLAMPKLHGFDLAREMLAIRPDLPIVITSGYVRREDQEEAERIGVAALILKPNTIEELGGTLQELFSRKRATRSAG
jgi:PAS domain S-box-containing protein